jgi:hypothetical protein
MPVQRPDLNGLRVQLPGHPEIYLIDEGCKRHIPNPPTFDNLFRNWDGIVQDLNVNDILSGPPIPDGAVLLQAKGAAEVWLIDGHVKRHVTSPAVMDRYNLRWPPTRVDPTVVNAIQTGRPVS